MNRSRSHRFTSAAAFGLALLLSAPGLATGQTTPALDARLFHRTDLRDPYQVEALARIADEEGLFDEAKELSAKARALHLEDFGLIDISPVLEPHAAPGARKRARRG